MVYTNDFADVITGLGSFAQGYQQGRQLREDRDMHMQQFNQKQQMAGLQYDMLKQRQEQSAKMQKYADAAEAVVMGNYGKAIQLHNELGGNDVASIEPIDNDNVRITYSDGAKESIIPRIQYAQVVASRGNPEQMIKSINSIAQGQRIQETAKANVEAKTAEAERMRQFKAEEAEKVRKAKETEWKAKFQTQYELAKMRAARAGGKGGASAWERRFAKTKSVLMESGEMSPKEADMEALRLVTAGADTEKAQRSDEIRLLKIESDSMGQTGRDAKERVAELRGELSAKRKKKQQNTGSGGVDFASLGFEKHEATGNWKNPKTGVYFRNEGGKAEAWSNSSQKWVPVK